MGDYRKQMDAARRDLHQGMSVPALYFAYPYDGAETPKLIDVRIHDNFVHIGQLKGTNFHYAEMEDNSPRIIFQIDQVMPTRGMVVSVSSGRAYLVEAKMPPDGITIIARVKRLSETESRDLPYPQE